MNLQVGVKVLLKNAEGKYLLVQRSEKKYPGIGGTWDIVGGRIDSGAPLIDNLKREVKEETQLELGEEPILVAAQDILLPEKHVVRLTYLGSAEGTPQLDEENIDFKWVSMEELGEIEPLDKYLKELLEKKAFERAWA